MAAACDPATYAELAGLATEQMCRQLGAPAVVAKVLGSGLEFGVKSMAHGSGTQLVVQKLRVLGALVCPDLDRCPAKKAIVDTFAAPMVADILRAWRPGTRPPA